MNELKGTRLIIPIVLFLSGFVITVFIQHYRDKAIEHNCAEYNSQTGGFEWRER